MESHSDSLACVLITGTNHTLCGMLRSILHDLINDKSYILVIDFNYQRFIRIVSDQVYSLMMVASPNRLTMGIKELSKVDGFPLELNHAGI